jgi:methionine synthase II (cobalamin-independent)
MAPPFRAEQLGSLLRPSELLSARAESDLDTSYASSLPEDIQRITHEAVSSAVQKQLSLSIRPITNGEYSRHIFYGGFFETLQGMEVIPALPIPSGFRSNFPSTAVLAQQGIKTRPGVKATGKIRHVKSAYMEEWNTLKSLLPMEQ